jgi:hypothetical protein
MRKHRLRPRATDYRCSSSCISSSLATASWSCDAIITDSLDEEARCHPCRTRTHATRTWWVPAVLEACAGVWWHCSADVMLVASCWIELRFNKPPTRISGRDVDNFDVVVAFYNALPRHAVRPICVHPNKLNNVLKRTAAPYRSTS